MSSEQLTADKAKLKEKLLTIGRELHLAESSLKNLRLALRQVQELGLEQTAILLRAEAAIAHDIVKRYRRYRDKYEVILSELEQYNES